NWSQQAYLKASSTDPEDLFGASIAISGNTVVVGAHQEDSIAQGVNGNDADDTASASGAAYVFTRSAGTWSQLSYVKASNTNAFDFFGGSVAISGDTIVLGAANEDSNATGVDGDETNNGLTAAGAAYIYR
ncbi:FG-GAP repeat protein, partial [Desulfobulbus sp. AH-315-M07]|nr:FG-GAP repeat protein [Desulfobulbus sp. AH-315-M07]